MAENKLKAFQIIDAQIAFSVGICMLVYLFIPKLQLLSACTAALMCSQSSAGLSIKSAATRILTTVVGGVLAVGVVVLDNISENYYVFILLSVLGLFLTLVICKLLKTPPIAGRIGCVTFILVVVVAAGPGRISYAVHRLIATLAGAAIAIAVSAIFAVFCKRNKSINEKNG